MKRKSGKNPNISLLSIEKSRYRMEVSRYLILQMTGVRDFILLLVLRQKLLRKHHNYIEGKFSSQVFCYVTIDFLFYFF